MPNGTLFLNVLGWMSLAILGGLAGCATEGPENAPADWIQWQARRHESVAGTNGWTTVIGLHWLKEGVNGAGSAATNDAVIQCSHVPEFVGMFTRRGTAVSFRAAPGVGATVDGQPVETVDLVSDEFSRPTRLEFGSVSIVVIKRGERIGLRVRDSEAERRKNFEGLHWFPYDPDWRITGRFVASPRAAIMRVPDVTGGIQEFVSPGQIVFHVQDAEYRLPVALEPENPDFFVMFHDETSGGLTYPAGRFLYVPKPTVGNEVVIDFNRAYTPPCGFTAFATCPVPPRQNWLPIPIHAGELQPASHP